MGKIEGAKSLQETLFLLSFEGAGFTLKGSP